MDKQEQEKSVRAIYEAGEVVKLELPDVKGKKFTISYDIAKLVRSEVARKDGSKGGWTKGVKRK